MERDVSVRFRDTVREVFSLGQGSMLYEVIARTVRLPFIGNSAICNIACNCGSQLSSFSWPDDNPSMLGMTNKKVDMRKLMLLLLTGNVSSNIQYKKLY